ncbi:MAG: hypothetical protein P4M09_21965 [Devosia sp.]|nr:hypothetical protein [Devosia sp.]
MAIEGLDIAQSLDDLPADILRAARLAVNAAARRAYTSSGRQIRKQVNFPATYVTGQKGRLSITKFASGSDLEAVITGRHRPTSLARFVTGSLAVGGANRKAGVRVEVKPGSVRRLPGAFLIRLRAGTETNLDTKSNLGLAVRTKDGRPPPGYKPLPLGRNLWLLYGPSIDQVFFSATTQRGVASDIVPDIETYMENEFLRLLDVNA